MNAPIPLEVAFLNERPRLVAWMTKLTGNHQIAEDIVQEAYRIAWQKRDNLFNISGVDKWLNAITHNIYKRWYRANGRQQHYEADLEQAPVDALAGYQLEHHELSDLLDRALALLSPENRAILIARYLEEQPQAKVARDLGMTENALAVRLHRGKMTLRKILDAELSDNDNDEWQETRLWCGNCGKAKYKARIKPAMGELSLICSYCCPDKRYPSWDSRGANDRLCNIKTVKSALNRLRQECYADYISFTKHDYSCPECGKSAEIKLTMPEYLPSYENSLGTHFLCANCGVVGYNSLGGITLSLPQAATFDKANPRFQSVSPKYLSHQGHDAVQIGFKSLRNASTFDAIFIRDSYRLLSVFYNGQDVSDES